MMLRVRWIGLRSLATIWGAGLLVGVALLFLPEEPKTALISPDGWVAEGAVVENVRPGRDQVSRSILEDPRAFFARTWSPRTGSVPGHLVSAPFPGLDYIAVPFAGYPVEPGVDLYLECQADRKRLPVAYGNAHETWVERTLHVGRRWCGSPVRLVAHSESRTHFIAVGTPFRSSRLAWFKESAFVTLIAHVQAWVVLIAPGFGFLWAVGIRRVEHALLASVPVTLVFGYSAFFALYYGGRYGYALVLLVTVFGLVTAAAKGREVGACLRREPFLTPFLLVFVLSLFYALGLYAADIGTGTFTANARYAPATWSTDNQLNQLIAEALFNREPFANLFGVGGWQVSDRPPLLAGLYLIARTLWGPLASIGDNARLLFVFYQVTGVVASTLWVVPVWILLTGTGLARRDAILVIVLLATLGPVVFNSTYVWPKMLSGALGLAAWIVYAQTNRSDRRNVLLGGVSAGGLLGLGMLSHGSLLFGLVPVLGLTCLKRDQARLRNLLIPLLFAALLYMPWASWQRFEDPPGNAVVKFTLAGTFGFDERHKGVWPTVRDAYSRLTPSDWLRMKWAGLRTLAGITGPLDLWRGPSRPFGEWRQTDFSFVLPSLRLANLGWVAMLVAAVSSKIRRPIDQRATSAATWVLLAILGLLMNALVSWYVQIIPVQSYLSLLLLATGLCTAIVAGPSWLKWPAIAAHSAYFILVWVWAPLRLVPVRPDYCWGWALTAVAVFLVALDGRPRAEATASAPID